MDKIRIGIVGLGPIAQNAHLPAIEKARDIHLQPPSQITRWEKRRAQLCLGFVHPEVV
jgi:predicted dehydrogenase